MAPLFTVPLKKNIVAFKPIQIGFNKITPYLKKHPTLSKNLTKAKTYVSNTAEIAIDSQIY
jgi:hypothetical protein